MTARRILLLGASGGVGTTVLAAALGARCARRGLEPTVVETRRGGLDVVCGIDGLPGPRLDDLAELEGEVDGPAVRAVLPRPGGLAVLAHAADGVGPPLAPARVHPLVDALATTGGVVVVDGGLAQGVDPALAAGCDDLLLVVGPGPHRLARAAGLAPGLDALAPTGLRLVLVGRVPEPELVAEHLGAVGVTTVAHDPGVDRDLAAASCPGRHGRGPLARGADAVLDGLGLTGTPGDARTAPAVPDREAGRATRR